MLAAISTPRLTRSAKLPSLTMKDTIKYVTYIVHVSVFSHVSRCFKSATAIQRLLQLANISHS